MAPVVVPREQVLALMRRLGLADRIPEARRQLPELIDLSRDDVLLSTFGLGTDEAFNALGSSL